MTRNVGKIANQGVELAVNGIPVRTKDFEWGLGFTFSKNWSEVKELWDDVTEYKLTSSYQVDFLLASIVGIPLLSTITLPSSVVAKAGTLKTPKG